MEQEPTNIPPVQPGPVPAPQTTKPPRGPLPVLPPTPPKPSKFEGLKSFGSTFLVLIAAPLIALSLTAFVFQSYQVDGPSMETTLENNDRLIVLKTPRTWARITHHDYIPHRGDIIVFVKGGLLDENPGQTKQLIKRVIALPGERVVVSNNVLTVYNKEHPDGFQPDKTFSYGSVIKETSGDIDLTVPAGQIFVCGDNRDNSLDSRSFGPIPAHDIIGKLEVRILPISNAQRF